MPLPLGMITANAASEAIGTGMGLILEGHNDRRQLRQQEKLNALQLRAQKDMAQFNYQQQLQMWKDTNYSAQMEQLTKAGLNPGLIYGMSGGGGATTGSPGGGGIGAGNAPAGGGEAMGLLMQKMQLGLMEEQRKNIEADTANKQADTANKPLEGGNIRAQTKATNAQEALTLVQTEIAQMTRDWTPGMLENIISKGAAEVVQLWNTNEITNRTKEATIQRIETEAANAIITGQLMKQGMEVNKAQIEKIAQEIAQGWERIGIEKFKAEIEANFKGIGQIAGNLIQQMFEKIDTITGKQNDQRPIKIK